MSHLEQHEVIKSAEAGAAAAAQAGSRLFEESYGSGIKPGGGGGSLDSSSSKDSSSGSSSGSSKAEASKAEGEASKAESKPGGGGANGASNDGCIEIKPLKNSN